MSGQSGEQHLQRITRSSVKELALEELKRYITSGVVAPGQRLPSERDLAERLGVGRSSVREAIKVLETVGLVESRVGEGTFITTHTGATIGRVIGFKLATWGATIVEIIGARQMFEVEAARVAATHATADDKALLLAELERIERASEMTAYLHADMNFHRLVARATQNSIVSRVVSDLIDLLEEVMHEAQGDQLPTGIESANPHRLIYEAIGQGRGLHAANAMREHLQFSLELWQAIVSLGTNRNV